MPETSEVERRWMQAAKCRNASGFLHEQTVFLEGGGGGYFCWGVCLEIFGSKTTSDEVLAEVFKLIFGDPFGSCKVCFWVGVFC